MRDLDQTLEELATANTPQEDGKVMYRCQGLTCDDPRTSLLGRAACCVHLTRWARKRLSAQAEQVAAAQKRRAAESAFQGLLGRTGDAPKVH